MKKTLFLPSLSFLVCIVLTAAMALFTTGCNGNKQVSPSDTAGTAVSSQTGTQSDVTVLGEGKTVFSLTVTDMDGKETPFEIHTDQKTVGAALVELNLIAGEESAYGLYVKTVNGTTVDYDTDGKYWAFYIDGAYASTGVDATDITEGAAYAFKVE